MPMNTLPMPNLGGSESGFDIGKILGGAAGSRADEPFSMGGGGGMTPAMLISLLFGLGGMLGGGLAANKAPAAPAAQAPQGNLYARKMLEAVGRSGEPATQTTTVSRPGEIDLGPLLQVFLMKNWDKMMGGPSAGR